MSRIVLPPGWRRPSGYSHAIAATGRTIFVSGQIGWDAGEVFHTDDFAGQVRQALENTVAILAAADARPEHIVRMTWYITDREAYLADTRAIGEAFRDVIGRHYPAMSVVEVAALIEERAQVEIETTAVVPD